MKVNFNSFEGEEPDLRFPFSPKAPVPEQVANLLFRFTEYQKQHRNIQHCLESISSIHYKVCDTKTLLELKHPIQALLFAREAIRKIEEALQKDIDFCKEYLINFKEKETE